MKLVIFGVKAGKYSPIRVSRLLFLCSFYSAYYFFEIKNGVEHFLYFEIMEGVVLDPEYDPASSGSKKR